MTAFGRGESSRNVGKIRVEMASLNRKHLEIKIHLPRELSHFEVDVRNWIAPHLGRGAVTLRISSEWQGKPPFAPSLNSILLKHYVEEGKKFEKESGYELPSSFWIEWGLKQDGIWSEQREGGDAELRLLLEEAIQSALLPFLEMKGSEGATLGSDLLGRFKKLEKEVDELSLLLRRLIPKLETQMKEFLSPYIKDNEELEERVLREVALLAKGGDFTEEIIRLKSHLDQAQGFILGKETQVGKALEFLLQEMQRETNTIGAKAQDLEVSRRVVEMKSELEKIREQLQNVE